MDKNLKIGILLAIIAFGVYVLLSITLWQTEVPSLGTGLDDFTEGTEIRIELEEGGDRYIAVTGSVLKGRLEELGVESTVLPEADKKHIKIIVPTTDPAELEKVRNIINSQAFFEQFVDGELCARGEEIQLDITSQAGATIVSGKHWEVFVRISGDAPERCALAMKGKAGHMTDIFLDRPRDSIIVLDKGVCEELDSRDFSNQMNDTGYTQLSFIEERANIPVVCYEEEIPIDEELGSIFEDNESENTTKTPVQEIRDLWRTKNKTNVILMTDQSNLPEEIQEIIEELGLTVTIVPKDPEQPYHDMYDPDSWINQVTGLRDTIEISWGLTYGNPIFNSIFMGSEASEKEALETVKAYKIWLISGNLPTEITIISERQITF